MEELKETLLEKSPSTGVNSLLSLAEENKAEQEKILSYEQQVKKDIDEQVNAATSIKNDVPEIFKAIQQSRDEGKIEIERVKESIQGSESGEDGNGKQAKSSMSEAVTDKMGEKIIKVFDTGFARICSAISGETESTKFRMTKSEKEDFSELAQIYFESGNWTPDPVTMIKFMFVIYFIDKGTLVYNIKKEKEYAQKRRPKRRVTQVEKEFEKKEIIKEEKKIDYSHTKEVETGRTIFDIDKKGYYIKTAKGKEGSSKYIQEGDRVEKPSIEILSLIKDGLSNAQIKSIIYE